jgi:hypothetical protein
MQNLMIPGVDATFYLQKHREMNKAFIAFRPVADKRG